MRLVPYFVFCFSILVSAAFLRKVLLVGEVSFAECLVVIFSLGLTSYLYWFLYDAEDDDSINDYAVELKELSSKVSEVSNQVKMMQEREDQGF